MMQAPSTLSLLQPVAAAAREAGALAMDSFRRGRRTSARIWSKEGGSPVSEADIAVDRFLRERLTSIRPGIGWLSEEAEIHPAEGSLAPAWVVDPIDGTRAYTAGEAEWGVSIALVRDGRPELACLFLPALDRLFVAATGEGAFLNDARLPPIEPAPRIAAGAKSVLDRFLAIAPDYAAHPKIPSLAARIAAVAEGRIAVAVASRGAHEWDLAAADLIVAESGGRLTDLDGKLLRYEATSRRCGELIASREADHDRLADALRGALAGRPAA